MASALLQALQDFKVGAGKGILQMNHGDPSVLTNVMIGNNWNQGLPRFGGKVSQGVSMEQYKPTIAPNIISPLANGQKATPKVLPAARVKPNPVTPTPTRPQPTPTTAPVAPQRVLGAKTTINPSQPMPGNPGVTPTPFPKNPVDGYVMGTPKEYMPVIAKAAQETGMPTSLLSALLAHESMRWNQNVISGKLNSPVGAQGIGQFMPATARGLGIKNPLDPNEAIPAAAKYFMSHYNKYGRPDYALAAYNAGGANVNKYNGIPPFDETQNYVKNILKDANTTFGGF